MDATINLLKELTEAHGVPGYEAPVRAVLRKHLSPLGELTQDKTGNLICKKSGSAESPRVMLAGHMDEIGFMVKHITKRGFLKFLPLGGWFDQILLGQRVVIKTRKGDVIGVIGAKPPHMLSPEARNKVVKKKDMYIDIGATSKDQVEKIGVRVGDPVVPRADFVTLAGGDTFMSKAFDDRVGTALIVSALKQLQEQDHPNTIVGVATVQEEIGLRGAKTGAWSADPDVAIILEIDIAGDVPGIEPEESSVKLGEGPSVLIYDARMIPNLKMRDFVIDTAEELEIPIQLSYVEGGATDGGMIHIHKTGVPTVVLSVASRHIHSDSSIIHRSDYEHAVELLVALLKRMDAATVNEFTQ
ncbi:MAG: M42 family metallopeptidase [Anaerolineales bacterium]|nr:M42 family metallopeptidase [Chloroflexota bacterium]MBL6982229.1 M42 family metallopeptidase [Anaerolineales bacterium]